MDCFKKMDWPKIPEDISQEAINFAMTARNDDPIKDHPAKADKYQKLFPNAKFSQYPVPESLEKWVRENLPITDKFVVRLQEHVNMSMNPPHKDISRKYAYNYLLTEGDAITKWFDDDQNEIACVQYAKNVWYFHESSVYHQVSGMTHDRLAVTIFIPEIQNHLKPIMIS